MELDVSDTGIGIPENELPRLFERFHRVPGVRGRTYEGSGIGLSLVQELVRLHGGTLRVVSVERQGSCFTVSIPAGFVHLPQNQIGATRTLTSTATQAAAYVEEALRWLPEEAGGEEEQGEKRSRGSEGREELMDVNSFASPASPASPAPPASSARILLVDDNADMRDYVRRLLSRDYEVEAVSNGLAALDAVQRYLPDLVLTDVMMPGLDGLGLLRSLRNDPVTQSIPIILLSARAGEESRIEGLEAGADDYLVKPFSGRELVAGVRTNIELAQLRREAVRSEIALQRSEEQLRVAQQAAGAGLWDWDIVADRVTWSDGIWVLLGIDPGSITPNFESFVKFLHPDEQELILQGVEIALAQGDDYCDEFRVIRQDGTICWFLSKGQVIRTQDGQPERLLGINIDITDRKLAEVALRESESRFRNIADHSPIMIWISAPDGMGVWFNQQWCEFTGQTLDEALGSGWLAAVHPEDAQSIETTCLQAHQRHEPVRLEYRLRQQDGEYRWVFDSAVARFDDTGVYLGYIGSIIDITDRKLAEAEVQRREREFRAVVENT